MILCSLRRNPLGMAGMGLLVLLLCLALGADVLAPYDPSRLTGRPFEQPNARHLLGTNDIGQDILSELIHGARISLLIGVLAAAIAVSVGTGVGLLAGYYGGALDAVLMRLVDVILVIPVFPLMVLLAAYLGQSLWNLVLVIGLLGWTRLARVVRSQVLTLSQEEYVLAARAVGCRNGAILTRHVMPGALPLALSQFVVAVSSAILTEAGLSFLGLGDPTQKSWGSILYYAQARNAFLTGAWLWWVLPPGLMIALSGMGFALLGLVFEETLNPTLGKGRVPLRRAPYYPLKGAS